MTEHGTVTQYINHGCRCDECRKVGAEYARDARARRADLPVPTRLHGKNSTYVNYLCRCQPCKDAHAAYQRQYWRGSTMSNITQLPQQQDGSLTAPEILEHIPGLTYRQLDFWNRTGRIQPQPGKQGSGHYHRYTPDQVAVISRMYRLLNLGFNLNAAHQVATDRATAQKVLIGVSNIVIEHVVEEED